MTTLIHRLYNLLSPLLRPIRILFILQPFESHCLSFYEFFNNKLVVTAQEMSFKNEI